jgi:hypothetical protein
MASVAEPRRVWRIQGDERGTVRGGAACGYRAVAAGCAQGALYRPSAIAGDKRGEVHW